MRYVIIGNSTAAIGCIEGIRRVDHEGTITLLASEPYAVYSRPLISYLMEGKVDEAHMRYRDPDFYKTMGVDAHLGVTVIAIDPTAHTVTVEGGNVYPYDRLMVATGSRPFLPPMPGLEKVKNQTPFMTLDHAHALAQMIDEKSRVLIIGAGLIGLKCAEGIAHRVAQVTVVDMAPHVLPSILNEDAAARIENVLKNQGIILYMNDHVASFTAREATLASGQKIPFDVVVTAVGVRPNVELVTAAGGTADRGILVDTAMHTSLPDVFAAGDCTQGLDCVSGKPTVLALLPNAYLQGETAGRVMAGEACVFDHGLALNAMGLFGVHMVTAGSRSGEPLVLATKKDYRCFYIEDDRLVGFILVGDVTCSGIYTALIREKTPLSTVDTALMFNQPQLAALSYADRAHKLGEEP